MNSIPSEIWTRDAKGIPFLVGSKCQECGSWAFPAKEVCPYCMTNGKSEKKWIGREGNVVMTTTCHTAPKGIQPPYSLGIVEIEHGLQVLAQVSGRQIRKGDRVELVVYTAPTEDNEEDTFWKYQVIEGGNN